MELENSEPNDTDQLQSLLIQLLEQPIEIIEAKTYLKAWRTKSYPVLLKCADGKKYVVKGKQAGRQIINDQIVARLGLEINAPVGNPKIINISQELIDIEPNLEGFDAGTAHGTEFIPDCIDQWTLIATSEPENRIRLVTLALLFGWTHANDHQFIFHKIPPRLIYSVDHGHFFPNPPEWRIKDLEKDLPATLDSYFEDCHFTENEFKKVYDILNNVTKTTIVQVVASPRKDWGISFEERLGMINYLTKRQQELQDHLKSRLSLGK
ncbi:MAG: HipA family kinase [Waterburya sp.]